MLDNVYSTTTKAQPGVLLGIGNPLLDISGVADKAFLDKYDLKADNQILCEEKHKPIFEDLVQNTNVSYLPGGAALNSIRAAQWSMQNDAEADGATVYTGSVGDDDYQKELKNQCDKTGVNAKFYFNKKGEPTGTCAVVITNDGKDRSLVANLAAANVFQEEGIDNVWTDVENAQYFYSTGFFQTTEGGPKAMARVGKYAADNNKTVVMNLSAPFLCQFFRDQINAEIGYANIVIGNESEMAAWGEANKIGDGDLHLIGKHIANLPSISSKPRLVIITQGMDPTLAFQGDKKQEFPVMALDQSKIVDTNGAGDCFVAGFLTGLIYNKSIEDCVQNAHDMACVCIQQPGCTFPEKSAFNY